MSNELPDPSQIPTFGALRQDPQFRSMDAAARRDVLRIHRQNIRWAADKHGILDDAFAQSIDDDAREAAKEEGIELEPGFFAGVGQDFVKGVNQVRLGFNTVGDDDAGDIAQIAKYEAEHPGSLAGEDLQADMSGGTGLFDAIGKNPAGFLKTTVAGTAASLPGSVVSAGGGLAAGLGTTAATANPLLGVAAGATAAGATSEYLERGGRYLEKLREAGAPVTDGPELKAWLAKNEDLAAALKLDAHTEALPTAALDAAAAALPAVGAGARAARGVESKVLGKLIEGGVEQGLQAGLGAAGSVGSNLVAGEEIDTMGALQEGLGEFINPLELLGPAGRIGRKAFGKSANQGSSPANQGSQNRDAEEAKSSLSPVEPRVAPAPRTPETGIPVSDDDDLLGAGDLKRAMVEEARAQERAEKLAAINATPLKEKLSVFGEALTKRADEARERGREGDAVLSVVEAELARMRDAQEGGARQANLGDIAKRLRETFAGEQDADFVDALALDLHGADATSSRVRLDMALDTVRAAREAARVDDTPLRKEREAREARERRDAEVKAELRAEADARATAEHEAEIARLDAARVTTSGEPDWGAFDNDELSGFAHGDDATPFLATIAEAQRMQDANPDYADRPRGALFNEWRGEAARVFDKRMQEEEAAQTRGPSLRELILSGKFKIPTKSAIYAGELRDSIRPLFSRTEWAKVASEVEDGEAGDRMLEKLAQRLTVDEGFSFLDSSGADTLDAVARALGGEDIRPDWNNEGIDFSRQRTMDLGAQGVGYELPNSIRNLTPKWGERTLDFKSSLDKAVYYATAGEPSATRDSVRAHIEDATEVGAGVVAAMGRTLRERIRTEAARSGERIEVPEVSPRIIAERDGVLFSRAGIDSGKRADTIVSHDAQAQADAALATEALRKYGELGAEESIVPVELRKGRDSRELADQIRGARGIAKAFGRKLILFRAPEDFPADGFVLRSRPNLIFLNVDAQRPVLAVTGHELMHGMETDAPRLAAAVKESLREYRSHFEVYEAFARRDGYSDGQIESEFAADVLGDTLLRQSFVDRLAAKSPRVFAEFVRYARRFIDSLRARMKASRAVGEHAPQPGYGTRNFMNHLDAVDEMLARSMVKWRDRIRNGTTGENDIGVRNLEDPALRPFKYPSVNDDAPEVMMSRRKAKPLNREDAQSELDAAKAKRDALPPHSVEWRRATAKVTEARRALTDARQPAAEALPLAESDRDKATQRLAMAQQELAKLQAMGKKVGGEAYKDAPVYKKALAERDAAFAAVTELAKGAPAAKVDPLATMSAEREKLFRELNEGQPSPEEQSAKQSRLAELNREIKKAENGAGQLASADWNPENFNATAWAQRILDSDMRSIPGRDRFAALGDNRIGELVTELRSLRDEANAGRVDTVLTNLAQIGRDRRTRGAPAQPGPVSREEKATATAEAKEVISERDKAILDHFNKTVERRRSIAGDDWNELLELPTQPERAPKAVTPDEDFIPTDAYATVPESGELEAVEPSAEDAAALGALDSIVDAASPRNLRDERRSAEETAAQMERDRNRKAGDAEPPKRKTPGEVDGEREYEDRGAAGPVSDVYGVTKSSDPVWKEEKRDWKTFVQGFTSAVPEIPRDATHLKGIVEGYKALSRGQEVAVHDAQESVAHILEPIMGLEKPADPRQRKALAKLRGRQAELAERLEALKKDNAMPVTKKALRIVELAKEHKALKVKADTMLEAMAEQPLVIFENFILWRDLFHRAVSLKRENGDDIALPFGVNPEEARVEAEKWAQRVKEAPESAAIRESIKRHEKEVTGNWEDFKKRHLPIEGVWNGGRAYYPHVLPEYTTGRPDRVAKGAGLDFRAYLQKPVGSVKAIETDYAKAMFLHVAAIKADNLHQDIVRRDFASLDATWNLEREIEAMRKQGKGRVPSLPALASSRGLVAFDPGDAMRHALAPVVSREAIGKAIGRVLTDGPLAEQLEGLAKEGIRLTPEMFHEGLVQEESKPWYVPKEAAAALREIGKREESLPFDFPGSLGRLNRAWKRYQLFTPHNYLRYEFNNTVADTTKLAAVDPGAFREMGAALREVLAFLKGEDVDKDTKAAFRLGVFDSPTVRESEDIAQLREFDGKLMTTGEQAKAFLLKYLNGATYSRVREATYRLAKYRADLKRIRKGDAPVYAGAYWKDVEAIGESAPGAGDQAERRAAAISLATLNDVHAVSRSGQWLRRNLIPFYSFVENNFRYHLNLYRNMHDMVAAGKMTRAEMAKLGAKSTAAFTGRAAVGIASRLALPIVAMALWNSMVGGDDELSEEDRRRLHLNLGRDAEGRRRVIYLENDLMAVLRWFGGNRAMGNAIDAVSGRTNFATAAKDWAEHLGPDFLNSAAAFGPAVRVPVLAATGKQMFPDVTDMRTVHGKDKWYAVVSEMVGLNAGEWIRSALDDDFLPTRTASDQFQQMVLQVRRRDPESWAFYKMREKSDAWQEERTGKGGDRGALSSPEMTAMRSFRRAIFRGDVEGALSMYDRLLKYGYTSDRLAASVRSFDPLSAIPKGDRKAFVEQLDEHEKKDLDRAFLYAERYKFLGGNRAKALFPKDSKNPAVSAARAKAFEDDPRRREMLRDFMEEQRAQDDAERRIDAEADKRKSMSRSR